MKQLLRALVVVVALAPMAAWSQFDNGASVAKASSSGSSKPWSSFKLDKKKKIKLDFRNANVDMVLQLFQQTSGITILHDPNLTQPITLSSAKAVSLDEAFTLLDAALDFRGFSISKSGNFLTIKAKEQKPAFDMSAIMSARNSRQGELHVYVIKYANASDVASTINEVFQQDTSNNPFAFFNPFGGFGRGRNRGGGGFNFGGSQSEASVRASSDDYSNSVIVNAPSDQQDQVANLIEQIDRPMNSSQTTMVYPLKYADATSFATVVQNVLTSQAPLGRGGNTSQSTNFQSRFQQMMRFGSSSAGFGQVVADARTNSLVVTATPDVQKIVAQVITDVDKPTETKDTTFVFQLANAKADSVAQLLNQTFGNKSGSNPNFRFSTSTSSSTSSTRSTSSSTRSSSPPTLGGDASPGQDPNSLDLLLQDPSRDNGQLLTTVGVSQFFGGGGFGGGFGRRGFGSQSSNSTTNSNTSYGPDASGHIVSLRDLTGQITVIPDISTNSIIVVAPPDSLEMVRNLLTQLDQIPQQVIIETTIVEATLDATNKLGVEWTFAQNKAFGNRGTTGSIGSTFGTDQAKATGFKYTLTGGDLTAFMNALRTDQRFNVLSTPRIFTSNNVQAQINVSQSLPYVTSQTTNTTGTTITNYAFLDVGIILTVTPRITANGYVTLDVTQTANDLQGYTDFNAPIVNQREAQTTVSVLDGETVILGGIIRTTVSSTVNKVPILGDIPFLGNLFRSTSAEKQKTELLVFLTPHIVRNAQDARDVKSKGVQGLSGETQKSLRTVLPQEAPLPAGNGGG